MDIKTSKREIERREKKETRLHTCETDTVEEGEMVIQGNSGKGGKNSINREVDRETEK